MGKKLGTAIVVAVGIAIEAIFASIAIGGALVSVAHWGDGVFLKAAVAAVGAVVAATLFAIAALKEVRK